MNIRECDCDSSKIRTVLGEGSYGIVKEYGPDKVIKFNVDKNAERDFLFLACGIEMNANAILAKSGHPNITQFLGACDIEELNVSGPVDQFALIFEKVDTLNFYQKHEILKNNCLGVMSDILLGIEYIHSFGFVHRDLSTSNIFFINNVAKIGDLGTCIYLNDFAELSVLKYYNQFPEKLVNYNGFTMDIFYIARTMLDFLNHDIANHLTNYNNVDAFTFNSDDEIKDYIIKKLECPRYHDLLEIIFLMIKMDGSQVLSATQLLNLPQFNKEREKINRVRERFPPNGKRPGIILTGFDNPSFEKCIEALRRNIPNKMEDFPFPFSEKKDLLMKYTTDTFKRYISKKILKNLEIEKTDLDIILALISIFYLVSKIVLRKSFYKVGYYDFMINSIRKNRGGPVIMYFLEIDDDSYRRDSFMRKKETDLIKVLDFELLNEAL